MPENGFIPAPAVPQPNIFPLGWRLETPKLAEIYERAKVEGFNPSSIPWNTLDVSAFSADERIAMMYWWALLSNFDSSGPAVFARAMIHAFETHEEDPGPQMLLLDHPRRDQSRGMLPARDSVAGAERPAGLHAARPNSNAPRSTTSIGSTITAAATGPASTAP